MTTAVTGASGFIGRRLIQRLRDEGHSIRVLGRHDPGDVQFFRWEAGGEPPPEALEGVDAIIHLAGEPVGQRWNKAVKQRIRDSRVIGTRNLVSALSSLKNRPRTMIAASAVGYYGDRGEELLTERSAPGSDFLASVCVDWEKESNRAAEFGLRVVMLRSGIVLGAGGGALKEMAGPFKAGFGGPIGSGRQWVSWIHIDDEIALIMFALRHDSLSGPINATAPEPVRNAEFAQALGKALHRPSLIPTPGFALKLMFGEMSEALLASERVIPEAAMEAGFQFEHPELTEALAGIFQQARSL